MQKESVVKSLVLQKRNFCTKENRNFVEMELLCPNFSFKPGQFVMVRINAPGVHWAYPYMVQKTTEKGFVVAAHQRAALAAAQTGTALCFWGPSGRAVSLDENTSFVAQAATTFLIAPLVQAMPGCKLFIVGGSGYTTYAGEAPVVQLVKSGKSAAQSLQTAKGDIITALNVDVLEEFMGHLPQNLHSKTSIFASTNVACGIGACKACHLHNKNLPLGIAVCCAGPFVPWQSVDISQDKKCFHQFL